MKSAPKILTILFIFSTSFLFSQSSKKSAKENITLLKDGALLVRLKTSQNQINAYTNKGMLKEAEEIRLNQEIKNKAIAEAFKNNYSFSKIYFFYSNYSTEVKEGKGKQYLMNAQLQADSSFTGNYLVGEFDESSGNQLKAFFIKNENYEALHRPFPFLVKLNKMLVSTKSEVQIVKELNVRLVNFWKKQ